MHDTVKAIHVVYNVVYIHITQELESSNVCKVKRFNGNALGNHVSQENVGKWWMNRTNQNKQTLTLNDTHKETEEEGIRIKKK